jgi:hypothetical protein
VVVEREAALDKDIERYAWRVVISPCAGQRPAARVRARCPHGVGPRFSPRRPAVVCLSLRRLACLKKVDRWIVHEAL